MNKIMVVGRMTSDAEMRYTQGENPMAIARFRVAVDRKFKKEGEPTADFIPCKAFGNKAEIIDKYFKKGRRIGIEGRLTSGSYTNVEGKTIYTLEVIVDNVEFVDNAPTQNNNINNDNEYVEFETAEGLPWA